ncbi:Aldehyde dehydrogenase [Sesbania bispinosa]|nr:Aldehyde dehydrogenase [Sesbania bispinosa]
MRAGEDETIRALGLNLNERKLEKVQDFGEVNEVDKCWRWEGGVGAGRVVKLRDFGERIRM